MSEYHCIKPACGTDCEQCREALSAPQAIDRLRAELESANRECEVRNTRELKYLARAQTAEARADAALALLREYRSYHPNKTWIGGIENGHEVAAGAAIQGLNARADALIGGGNG